VPIRRAGTSLHKALDCVTIDGVPAPRAEQRDRPGTETQPLLILDTLPRTGSGRLLLLGAGVLPATGGAAVTPSVPRRRARRM
jgi:hypothetical protein